MIIFVSADSEAFVVLDGELVAVVEGFAEFVFFELLFVVGRDHCEADFGYAVLEEFELVGGYPELGDGADVCVGKDDVVHYYLVIAVFVGVADDGAFEFDEFVGEGADFHYGVFDEDHTVGFDGGDYGVEAVLFGYAVGEGVAVYEVFLCLGGEADCAEKKEEDSFHCCSLVRLTIFLRLEIPQPDIPSMSAAPRAIHQSLVFE